MKVILIFMQAMGFIILVLSDLEVGKIALRMLFKILKMSNQTYYYYPYYKVDIDVILFKK